MKTLAQTASAQLEKAEFPWAGRRLQGGNGDSVQKEFSAPGIELCWAGTKSSAGARHPRNPGTVPAKHKWSPTGWEVSATTVNLSCRPCQWNGDSLTEDRLTAEGGEWGGVPEGSVGREIEKKKKRKLKECNLHPKKQ